MLYRKNYFFVCLVFSLFSGEKNRFFTYGIGDHITYMNPVGNGLFGLAAASSTLAILKKVKPHFFNRYPKMLPLIYGVTALYFPYFISRLQANNFYRNLSYEYLLREHQSIKENNFLFYKRLIMSDYKDQILEKFNLKKNDISYKKYELLLDMLIKSPSDVINGLKTRDLQSQFLNNIILIDRDKHKDKNCGRPFFDSAFWYNSKAVRAFLEKGESSFGAAFIFLYWKDNRDQIKKIIKDLDATKIASMCNVKVLFENNMVFQISNEICLDILNDFYDSSDNNEQKKGKQIWEALLGDRQKAIENHYNKQASIKEMKIKNQSSKENNQNNRRVIEDNNSLKGIFPLNSLQAEDRLGLLFNIKN